MSDPEEHVARMEATSGIGRVARKRARAELEKHWFEENRDAIAHYNRRVAEHGLLSDDAGRL
jgi:post-segregation antitoxin (ccd killing protein)